jgi:glycosyltransferase involved in cell wall biosynthesis
MTKISCIIPTYNEEGRIAQVLNVVSMHPLIDEVIVVDDGSTDNTRNIVAKYPNVQLIIHEKNQGKSYAVYTGIKASQGEFLLFIDADLVGLNAQNVTDLITPILNGTADVSISLRRNTPPLWRWIGLDYISGERCLSRGLLDGCKEDLLTLSNFGLEVFMNKQIIKNKSRIEVVLWKNVRSPFKYKKYGLTRGVISEIKMRIDIYKTISLWEKPYQIYKMLKLKI